LLVALGIRYTLPLITQHHMRIMVIVGLLIAGWQEWYYFEPQLDYLHRTTHNFDYLRLDPDDAIVRAVDFPAETQLHLITTAPLDPRNVRAITDYLTDDLGVTVLLPEEVTAAYLESLPREVDHAFFIEPGDE